MTDTSDDDMQVLTEQDLRDIICTAISGSIEMHRSSREAQEPDQYERPTGEPTDEETDDFIASNPLFDEELVEQLSDPGFLGFPAKRVRVNTKWMEEFRRRIDGWSNNQTWLAGDMPWREIPVVAPTSSELWTPRSSVRPGWFDTTPSVLILAAELVRKERLLSEMHWRDFEKLIGILLEREGWRVTVTRPSKDGGVDVVAEKEDDTVGRVLSIWQAKKYSSDNKVKLHEVRELSAVRHDMRATKGVIVTTSHLTRDAIQWIKRDQYQLSFKDHEGLERWIRCITLTCL